MSEDTRTEQERMDDEQAEARAEASQEAASAPESGDTAPDEGSPNKREAKYRVRAVAAENRAERLEREKLEGKLSDLHDPADFWLGGLTMEDLRNDEGDLCSDRIDHALARLQEAHPHWFKEPEFGTRFVMGVPTRGRPSPSGPSWSEAIKAGE